MDELDFRGCNIRCIDVDNLPDSEGIFYIFRDVAMPLEFSSDTFSDYIRSKGTLYEPFILKRYFSEVYNEDDNVLLFIDFNKNIKKGIIRFLNTGRILDRKEFGKEEKGKLIWQIKEYESLNIGYMEVSDCKKQSSVYINSFKSKYEGAPLANQRFSSNDAIPSWSGYNFQGASMIIEVLRRINAMNKSEIHKYEVELEKYEDYVIYYEGIPNSLYQVKATLGSNKQSDYKEAIVNLEFHKEQLLYNHSGMDEDNISCFLVTANEIVDWSNTNVLLYDYNSKSYIPLEDVIENIKKEIKLYYEKAKINFDNTLIEKSYAYLCQEVDRLIYQNHQNRLRESRPTYKIKFSKFDQIMRTSFAEMVEERTYYNKRRAQEAIFKSIERNFKNFCESCTTKDCETCSLPIFVSSINKIDIFKYKDIISLIKSYDDSDYQAISTFGNNDTKSLLSQFKQAQVDWVKNDNAHSYIERFDTGLKVIPTTLDFTYDEDQEVGIQKLFKSISYSDGVQQTIDNSALTTRMDENTISYEDVKITSVPKKEETPLNFNSVKKSLT